MERNEICAQLERKEHPKGAFWIRLRTCGDIYHSTEADNQRWSCWILKILRMCSMPWECVLVYCCLLCGNRYIKQEKLTRLYPAIRKKCVIQIALTSIPVIVFDWIRHLFHLSTTLLHIPEGICLRWRRYPASLWEQVSKPTTPNKDAADRSRLETRTLSGNQYAGFSMYHTTYDKFRNYSN